MWWLKVGVAGEKSRLHVGTVPHGCPRGHMLGAGKWHQMEPPGPARGTWAKATHRARLDGSGCSLEPWTEAKACTATG